MDVSNDEQYITYTSWRGCSRPTWVSLSGGCPWEKQASPLGFPAVHTVLQKELKSHKIFVGYFVFVFEIIAPIICLLDMRIYIFALASTK